MSEDGHQERLLYTCPLLVPLTRGSQHPTWSRGINTLPSNHHDPAPPQMLPVLTTEWSELHQNEGRHTAVHSSENPSLPRLTIKGYEI